MVLCLRFTPPPPRGCQCSFVATQTGSDRGSASSRALPTTHHTSEARDDEGLLAGLTGALKLTWSISASPHVGRPACLPRRRAS